MPLLPPTKAIERLPETLKDLNRICHHLRLEADTVIEHWDVEPGTNSEHRAAGLLGWLRPHLAELSSFASMLEKQIAAMEADPFGRNDNEAPA
jgi:hypothetical protein